MVSAVPQEYSYFDQPPAGWAGPRHWKLRPLTAGRQGPAPDAAKPRRKRDTEAIDFAEECDWADAFAPSKKSIKLKPATMKKWNEEKTTLPEDLHYDIAAVFKSAAAQAGPDVRHS
ncbi:condensin complex subunit 2-like [Pollicipes pollicipes]|uniref:condensin complex subunit 2-like n=1 Tax=Pollicipes pollicipes TaxID=41117 RepID=UPI001884D048|nr:condensin complex subunit 2-like [Pollicipes pollicipes]